MGALEVGNRLALGWQGVAFVQEDPPSPRMTRTGLRSRFPHSLSDNYVLVTLPAPSLGGRGWERASTTSFPILQMRN